jgi:ATP-dependent DNA helicase RecQ
MLTARSPIKILQDVFGFPAFRGVQEQVVSRVLGGRHTLAIMPTGAGKSLCYQLPSVARAGCCVVISPLIALMHDQLRAAKAIGIRAACLTSVDTDWRETHDSLRNGQLDLLYVAPERVNNEGFRSLLRSADISLFAIDEAHCVSEWGHDFRPDYRMLRPMLDEFGDVPRLALTATADAHTRQDILHQLGIEPDGMIISGFDRPNIRYAVHIRDGLSRQIADLVAANPGPGIVYAQTRAATEKMAEILGKGGKRQVRAYHAGLPPEVRSANQAAFIASEDMVMVATVAFGMGIDKPDVRFVAHAGLPKSIESYYQESGRAGRDGEPAQAHLFWGAEDFARARIRIAELEDKRQQGERTRISALGALVETGGCRRAVLLRHFGENPSPNCGNCDNCLTPPASIDATETARKFLSAIFRTGQSYGMGHLEAVLTGKNNDKIMARGHDHLSVFGIVDATEASLLKPVSRALLLRDAVEVNEHGGMQLGPNARPILRGEESVSLALPPKKERRAKRGNEANPVDDPLFDALRACRRELSQAAGVPPYVIFHDSSLREMATIRPINLNALSRISGVGTRKLEEYGQAFLDVILRFED